MVDGLAALILVDDGEGGGGDLIRHAERLAQRLDKRRLAGTHSAVEGKNARRAHRVDELARRFGKRVGRGNADVHRLIGAARQEKLHHGERHVPHNDGGEAAGTQAEAGETAQEEDVFHLVVLPREVLELEGKQGNLRHQKERSRQHEEEKEGGVEEIAGEEGVLTHNEAAPEEGIGRSGHADERGGLARVEVELGQTQRRESRHDERRVRHHAAQMQHPLGILHLEEQREEDHGRRHAEGDDIGQRVELLADGGGDGKQTRRHAVEEVEHGAQDDESDCPHVGGGMLVGMSRTHGGDAAADEVATGDAVGDVLLHNVAITVSLPVVFWPTSTCTLASKGR